MFLRSGWMAAQARGAGESDSEARLSVRLYNYTAVPDQTLAAAEQQAGKVFRAAHIMVTWVDCPLSENDIDKMQPCTHAPGPVRIILIIVPVSKAPLRHLSGELGFTSYPDTTYVFSDRVGEFSHRELIPEEIVLGEIIAHELGHVLLGHDSHSSAGIMRPILRREDLMGSRAGFFTTPQSKQMRARMKEGIWLRQRERE